MTTTKITTRWNTICTVGYTGPVSRDQDQRAHGGVTHCEARRTRAGRLQGRKINTNGRHEEVGEPFDLTGDQLDRWQRIAEEA